MSIEFVIVVFISLLLFFSLKFNFGINENKEYFSILFASVIKLLPFFVQLLRLQNTLRYTEPFVNEINENIDLLEKFQTKDISNTTLNYNFKKISIKSIVFSYEKNLIINNAELNIELNKFVSISGPSGSGKTTLLNILCGLLSPNQKIFFDEKEVDSKTKLSNLIAYVPQDKFVFEGEVWKNISLEYEKKNCDFKKINKTLKLVRLDIDPEFQLFSNGQNLSGGQKQRLILARALYFQKKLLFWMNPPMN